MISRPVLSSALTQDIAKKEIKAKITAYAQKCEALARLYGDRISKFESDEINNEIGRENAQQAQIRRAKWDELRKLGQEESFIEDFDTESFN